MFDLSNLANQQLRDISLELYDISINEYVKGRFLHMKYPNLGKLFAAIAVEYEKRECFDSHEWIERGRYVYTIRGCLFGIVLPSDGNGFYNWYVINNNGKVLSSGLTESKLESKNAVEGAIVGGVG